MEFNLQVWVIVPLLIVAFLAGFVFGARRAKSKNTDLRSRLRLACDQISEDAKAIADIQADIDQVRRLFKAKARRTVIEPIVEDVEARVQTLAMSNRTTDHILTAEKLAIRDEAPLVPKQLRRRVI